jgi:hypothetical protein
MPCHWCERHRYFIRTQTTVISNLFAVRHECVRLQVRELPALRPVVLLAKCLLRQAGCYRAGASCSDGISAERAVDGTNQHNGSVAEPEVTDSTGSRSGRSAGGNQNSSCSVSGTALAHMAAASIRWQLSGLAGVLCLMNGLQDLCMGTQSVVPPMQR